MGAASIARVLSRTKLFSNSSSKDASNEQHKAPSSRGQKDTTSDFLQTDQYEKIFPGAEMKPRSISIISTPSSVRKHSYASVKEDSDSLQSFKVRRPLLEAENLQTLARTRHDSISELYLDSEEAVEDALSISQSCEDVSIIPEAESDDILCPRPNLDTVPDEILDLIFSLVTLDHNTDRLTSPLVDVFSLLFVSKSIHAAALRVLYRHVKIPQSKSFFKFVNSLAEDEHLGDLVQCLDFSHYSNIGFGRTKTASNATPYLTPITLKSCLDKTAGLKSLLFHEHVDDELDTTVLTKIFSMPSIQALDFCACSSNTFTRSFTQVMTQQTATFESFVTIQRLSLHECTILQSEVFEALMPKLAHLTHLDVAHTMINDKALISIPTTARITHLNIERCNQLTGEAVVEFLITHPAVKDTIVYLNLHADSSRYRLLSEHDLDILLPTLSTNIKSLNLGGARINESHVSELRRLATHVEELGLKGADLSLGTDILKILSMDSTTKTSPPKQSHTVRYLDLSDIPSVNQCSLTYSPTTIIEPTSSPLEVIELGESVRNEINRRAKNIKNPEWKVRELGRRGWYVRQDKRVVSSVGLAPVVDDGYRDWKMGAHWWGMRKIPVHEQSVGGMYGYFMFKRA